MIPILATLSEIRHFICRLPRLTAVHKNFAFLTATAALASFSLGVWAQDKGKPASSPPVMGAPATAGKPNAPANAATMQIRREISGSFLCRFVTPTDESASLVPLPAPVGSENVIAIPVPSTLKAKDALLEVVDTDHSRVARLKLDTAGVTTLNDSAFKFIQTVLVPVQVKGKGGLTAATVTLASGDKSYTKSVTLTPSDTGTAKFANVPLGKPITVTVTAGANAPYSATQTLTVPTSAEGSKWPIEVAWPDAQTVPLPATPAATPTGSAPGAVSPSIPSTPTPAITPPATPAPPVNADGPLSGVVSTVVSLLFLGGCGYGLFWAYQNGHLKALLDKLGIQTQPAAMGGPQVSPFDKPQRTPIQPITDGTAEPLGGSNFAGGAPMSAAPVASTGPRLVATMGTYAGNIFPLAATSQDVGRDAGNGVALPNDTNASRRHATLQTANGQTTIMDNGSSNGTFVNGVRIAAQTPHPLHSGDEVQIGMTRFRFEG